MIVSHVLASSPSGGNSVGGAVGAYLLLGVMLYLTYRHRVARIKRETAHVARAAGIREATEVFDGDGDLVDLNEATVDLALVRAPMSHRHPILIALMALCVAIRNTVRDQVAPYVAHQVRVYRARRRAPRGGC